MEGITKGFPGVVALAGVDFGLLPGEVHVLLGENGAGKSTLVKIMTGAYQKDAGTIFWKGQPVTIDSPGQAQRMGISVIYQEFNLIPQLSVGENIFITREPLTFSAGPLRVIDWPRLYRESGELLRSLDLSLDPRQPVEGLGVAQQQMVEIAKALSVHAEVIIMDEPTSALTGHEIDELFKVIRKLRSQGKSIIYITHRLDEVKELGDRATVFRDGKSVDTVQVADTSIGTLIQLMVGRSINQQFPKVVAARGAEVLRVEGLSSEGTPALHDISFSAYAGEVLGISGLVGAGRTELVRAIFGADPYDAGHVYVDNSPVHFKNPSQAIHAGVGLLPESRKEQGLVLVLSVGKNITMAHMEQVSSGIFLNRKREVEVANKLVQQLRIRTPNLEQAVQYLSGGNQQKVVLAKWLTGRSKLLIFDEPTRGIDVGAKVEVYQLMNELTAQGVAILMVSSELLEVLGMSDRIMVMHEGRQTGIFSREEATQEILLRAALGEAQEEPLYGSV
ncbi:MAG: sugar ABC transporter ATP-binding protein [Chloroflexota bacterium]|nr:sugar ABC transporter ATP-binding protein [Chloroflexota bacterium]